MGGDAELIRGAYLAQPRRFNTGAGALSHYRDVLGAMLAMEG